MRSVKHFTIEEGQNSELLCAKINQYAEESGLLIFSISFNHYRSAFVIFEQDDRECAGPVLDVARITGFDTGRDITNELQVDPESSKAKIVISIGDIKQDYLDRDDAVIVSCKHGGAVWTGTGKSTAEAISKMLDNMNSETHEVYVNCGSNGINNATFFYREHLKNTIN